MQKLFSLNSLVKLNGASSKNSSFAKGTIRVCATGKNINNFDISKKAIEDAVPTLYNTPILGKYDEESDDFGSHEYGLQVFQNEHGQYVREYVGDTYPLGVIPESANYWFEDVVEDGVAKTYLMADCLIWKRMKKEYSALKRLGSISSSMEIDVLDGKIDVRTKEEFVEKFQFTGNCVLGSQTDPCFKSAQVQIFSKNEEVALKYDEMISDMKVFEQKGEDVMSIENQDQVTIVDDQVEETKVEDKVEVDETIQVDESPKVDETVVEEVVEVKTFEKELDEMTTKYNELKSIHDSLVEEKEAMSAEFARLVEFENGIKLAKRQEEAEALFTRFEMIKEDGRFEEIKNQIGDKELDIVEQELLALFGKIKMEEFASQTKEKTFSKLDVEAPKTKEQKAYGGLLDHLIK